MRKKVSRQEIVYRVALAGISAALASLFVGLSVLVRFSTVAFYIAAGLALMVPLTRRYVFSSALAYVVSSLIGFFAAGDIAAVGGYIVYFGPMAIITGLLYNFKVKWFISVPVKLIYINGALALLYFVLHTIVIDARIMDKLPYYALAIIGSVLLIAIDFVLQFVYSKLIPIVGKVLRRRDDDKKDGPVVDEEAFDDLHTPVIFGRSEGGEDNYNPADDGQSADDNDNPADDGQSLDGSDKHCDGVQAAGSDYKSDVTRQAADVNSKPNYDEIADDEDDVADNTQEGEK